MSLAAPKAVVLLSGGLDSATVLAIARDAGYQCHALSVAYGQRHVAELKAAERVAARLGAVAHTHIEVNLDAIGGSALTDRRIAVPETPSSGIPVTYVPARNTLFLSLALGQAEVVGARDGFFKDDEAVLAEINASGADILIVGTGAPRQEMWLHRYRDRLKPQYRWGVGALFTWISGHQARAPMLFQRLYLEWFWRLLHEPQRLFVRYFVHDLPFLLSLPLKGVKAEPGTAERP